MTKTPTWENIIQKLFDELVQPHLVDPHLFSIICGDKPLAKRKPDDPDLCIVLSFLWLAWKWRTLFRASRPI